jgi:predicted nucleic acid-binding protein
MRLFLDTNVVIDLLGERIPYYRAAALIATLADSGRVTIVVSSITYTTCDYVLSKYMGRDSVIHKLRQFKVISQVAAVDDAVIGRALQSDFPDFEDAVQYYSAMNAECGAIITRNPKHFKQSELPVMTPDEYLKGIGH